MLSSFGTAIYTNCAPGEGLEAVGGMQFQSKSADVDRESLYVVQRHLIYEPPEKLIWDRRPLEEFPRSFAHVSEGITATAAGIYLGREAVGRRQGNHLTHAILTANASAYGTTRPAQLFGAPFWQTEPALTTQSEPVTISWAPALLDAATVRQFVMAQPDGRSLLTALLDALLAIVRHDGPGARRVLFVSESAELVLQWLSAATLLIPQQFALRIGFKVFTADPARSALPVVAVHPEWSRSTATVEDDRGYAVFDLVRHRWTSAPESDEARHWAALFVAADALDVVDCVELAGTSALDPEAAQELAAAAVLGQVPAPEHADALVRWLDAGPAALREAYGGRLIDTLTQLDDPGLLERLDSVTARNFPSRTDGIRMTLLRHEIAHALRYGRPLSSRRHETPLTLSAASEAEASRLIKNTLNRAQGEVFDAVLRICKKFGLSIPVSAVHDASTAFVTSWLSNPGSGYDPSAWPASPPIYQMLVERLASHIDDRPAAAGQLADLWWDRLVIWQPGRVDLTSQLERALLSASMAHSDQADRLDILAANLLLTSRSGELSYGDLAAVLWDRSAPTLEEFRVLCEIVPPGTSFDPQIFTQLVTRAAATPAGLPELEVCAELGRSALLTLSPELTQLIKDHYLLLDLEASLLRQRVPRHMADRLRFIPQALFAAHAEQLSAGMLRVEETVEVFDLIVNLPSSVTNAYLGRMMRLPAESRRPYRIATAFMAARLQDSGWRVGPPSAAIRGRLFAVTEDWRARVSRRERRAVKAQLRPLGETWVREWKDDAQSRRFGFWRMARFGDSDAGSR